MSVVSAKTRRRVEEQGFMGLSDATLAEVGPWLRFSPAICMTWAAIATSMASPAGLWALMPFAALGAVLPGGHPFDIIYNHGIRHLIGTQRLPQYHAPRRFACGVATVWLAFAGWAFYSGSMVLGYVLGGSLVLVAAVMTFTDFCIASFFYGLVFGKPTTRSAERA